MTRYYHVFITPVNVVREFDSLNVDIDTCRVYEYMYVYAVDHAPPFVLRCG